ncbi:hypothetical protein CR513_51914, partial [Mucuna pruriens]
MNSIRQLLVKEAYKGGLMGYFRELKTLEILNEHFYWPQMRRDVHKICERCLTCKVAKSRVSLHGLYTSLPIPASPWIDISMNFLVDRLSKIGHFIPFHMRDDVSHDIFGGPYGVGLRQSYFSPLLVILKWMDKPKCFAKKSLRYWEDWIPYIEFAYNKVLLLLTLHLNLLMVLIPYPT